MKQEVIKHLNKAISHEFTLVAYTVKGIQVVNQMSEVDSLPDHMYKCEVITSEDHTTFIQDGGKIETYAVTDLTKDKESGIKKLVTYHSIPAHLKDKFRGHTFLEVENYIDYDEIGQGHFIAQRITKFYQ